VRILQEAFARVSCPITLRPRPKGLGSYYDSIKRTLEITNTENSIDFVVLLHSEDIVNCYTALGIVNTTFSPIPRSLRDFIATPKNTGYRSLHVRIHFEGQNYLIKIRTPSMDEWASFGILTEWDSQKPLSDEHWREISELLRTIGEYEGAGPKRKALIRLSEAEEIFVYSPKGDIYYLPKESIVLDFAYRVHSEFGDHCSGAILNNEWVPLTHTLKDGDSVEILTSPEPIEVDPDLENLCKTPKSRTAINKRLHLERQNYAQEVGREILLQEFRRNGLPDDLLYGEDMQLVMEFLNIKDLADLFTRVGQDRTSPGVILYYLKAPLSGVDDLAGLEPARSFPLERNKLCISELDKAIHKFARCCNPYPGQEGMVAILSERGITFHRGDCTDLLQKHDLAPQELLDVIWNKDKVWRHPLTFHVHVLMETIQSLLPALARAPSSVTVQSVEGRTDKHDQPMMGLVVQLRDFSEAQRFFACLPRYRTSIEDYGRRGGPRLFPGGIPSRRSREADVAARK